MTKTRLPMLPAWTPAIIIRLLGREPTKGDDWQDVRRTIVDGIDGFGLTATESATLLGLKNTEEMKIFLKDLATPRPGERTNLEKILTLLETLVRSNAQILKGQANLDARLAEIELRITEWNGFWASQSSVPPSTDS